MITLGHIKRRCNTYLDRLLQDHVLIVSKSGDQYRVDWAKPESLSAESLRYGFAVSRNRKLKYMFDDPAQDRIRCDLGSCGCRVNTFVWVAEQARCIWFENPKVASRSITHALHINEPDAIHLLFHLLRRLAKKREAEISIRSTERRYLEVLLPRAKRLLHMVQDDGLNLSKPTLLGESLHSTSSPSGFRLFFGTPEQAIESYPDFFSFSVLRDPFERLLSNWSMFVQKRHRQQQWRRAAPTVRRDLKLPDFLREIEAFENHHWNPQVTFLPYGIGALEHLTRLIRLEDFGVAWPEIARSIGIESRIEKRNATNRGVAREEYNEAMRDWVRDRYQEDIDLYAEIGSIGKH